MSCVVHFDCTLEPGNLFNVSYQYFKVRILIQRHWKLIDSVYIYVIEMATSIFNTHLDQLHLVVHHLVLHTYKDYMVIKNGTHQLKSLMILLISCCGIIKHGIKKLWHFQLSNEWCANVMLVMHHLKKNIPRILIKMSMSVLCSLSKFTMLSNKCTGEKSWRINLNW